MAIKIVLSKDQLIKEAYSGAMKEQKVLAFPQEKGPIRPYSNIFHWSHLTSNFGCLIPEHSHIGFEIFTYVLKGMFETFHKEQNQLIHLNEGDIGIIKAGKGLHHSEKIFPRSEVLQIWLDPNFDQNRRNEAELSFYTSDNLPVTILEGKTIQLLGGKNAPLKLNSKDVSLEADKFSAGFHTIICPQDTVISGYILDGYVEINDVMLGQKDFFKIDGQKEVQIASLVNSNVFLTYSPYQPEYQTYSPLSM